MVTPNYCFNYTKGKVVVVEGQGRARRMEEGLLISRLTFNIAAPPSQCDCQPARLLELIDLFWNRK